MSNDQPPGDHPFAFAVRAVRRAVVLVIGLTVLALGVIMLVTPGPAFVVIPVGLAILAIEFVWARRALQWVKRRIEEAAALAAANRQPTEVAQREVAENEDAPKSVTRTRADSPE